MLRKTLLLLLIGGLVAWAPAAAGDHSVRFRIGLFEPDAGPDYFEDKAIDFTGDASDFEDVVAGVDYAYAFTPHASLMVSLDHFEGQTDQEYLDFIDGDGFAIVHDTTLEVTPLTAAFVFNLTPGRAAIRPYVGVGGGVYLWRLTEEGDFIDFGDEDLAIFYDLFEEEGEAFGFFVVAGVEVPVGPYASFFVEGRWDDAQGDLEQDFDGFGDLDLSGTRVSGGFAWRF